MALKLSYMDARQEFSEAHVRPAAFTDIPALLAVEAQSFSTDRLSPRAFRHILARARADCLIACCSGSIVPTNSMLGYAVVFYRAYANVARLHSLAVDPRTRGRGIGALLLAAAEQAAVKRGASKIRLAVRLDNEAATALYRSRGYTELQTELAYYTDGMSALIMEKVLAVA